MQRNDETGNLESEEGFGCCRNGMFKHDPGCGTGKGAIH